MNKSIIIVTSIIVTGAICALVFAIRNGWGNYTLSDSLEDYVDDITFLKDVQTNICFTRNTDNGEMSLAPCEDVEPYLHPKLTWMAERIWYFQDLQREICVAGGILQAHPFHVPVPCHKVVHLLGPQEGRFRIDRRLKRD